MKNKKDTANLMDEGVNRMKHSVIKRCGRYALIHRSNPVTPYIVACGYDGETSQWNQGYYFVHLPNAEKEFEELSGNACAKCPFVNDGCIISKR